MSRMSIERAERYEGAGGGSYLEGQDIVALDAVLLVGLRPHLVDAPEGVEVVDIGRAEIDRERIEDVGDRHVQRARLVAVDLRGNTAGCWRRRW